MRKKRFYVLPPKLACEYIEKTFGPAYILGVSMVKAYNKDSIVRGGWSRKVVSAAKRFDTYEEAKEYAMKKYPSLSDRVPEQFEISSY